MRSLDQVDLRDKAKLLAQVQQLSHKIVNLLNENNENILHIIASEKAFKNSQSITGNKDMTLFEIIQTLVKQMKTLAYKCDKSQGQTPLHYAFKSGNLECALWMVQIIKKEYGYDAQQELLNSIDNDGMRPIDLLAFMIDDYHKSFIRNFHNEEKNYKLSKRFDAYSWGYSDEFQLGYTQLNNMRKYPKKITFTPKTRQNIGNQQDGQPTYLSDNNLPTNQLSIKDIKVANTYSLAITEDGLLFSWGSGINGHLGLGDENSRIQPEQINIDLKDEEKKIRKLKRKHRDMEEVEELMTLHSFVKNATKGGINLSHSQAFIEQQCLISLHNIKGQDNMGNYFLNDKQSMNTNGKNKKHSKKVKQFSNFQNEQALISKRELDCTNTGAVFSWGENDAGQLGFGCRKESSQGLSSHLQFSSTPKKVEQLSKLFVVDVACGDYHSAVITNLQEVYLWGSNKNGQLGIDMENCQQSYKAQKLVLFEYMNSSQKERFLQVKAKYNYTVLVYISDKHQNQFVALFAKSGNSNAHKKLEANVYLSNDYLLAMDMSKSIYLYKIFSQAQNKQQHDVCIVKRLAHEIYSSSNFIELYPTEQDIWAVNSLRQLLVCKDFKQKMHHNNENISFEPVNDVFNVMKAAIGQKHQVVIKIIKQLDDKMTRDINVKKEVMESSETIEDDFEIPMPSSCMMDMGISIAGGSFKTPSSFKIEEDITQNLDNALDLYEMADLQIIDELKINCLKFISLNIVSYLESTYLERLLQLPIYLIRDLENFIKLEDSEKYVLTDMRDIEESEYAQNQQIQMETGKKKEIFNEENCLKLYQELMEMFSEFDGNGRLQDQLKQDLCSKVHKFRSQLRKAHKKMRKGSSNVNQKFETPADRNSYAFDQDDYMNTDDFEVVVNYLDLVNDFIKEDNVEFQEARPSATVIIKKKKGGKQKPKPSQSQQQTQISSNYFFLKTKDNYSKQQEFEKHSLENDFMIVQQCDKKSNKQINKSKQIVKDTTKAGGNQGDKDEKFLLSDLLGLQCKTQEMKNKNEAEDRRSSSDLWNYLENQKEQENDPQKDNLQPNQQIQARERITSFEDIQREETEKKNRKISGGVRKNSTSQVSQPQKQPVKAAVLSEASTKNDWGLIKEEDEIDFDEVIENEKIKKEQARQQLQRDEELVRIMMEEELRRQEEEILQQVLRESAIEYSEKLYYEEQPRLQDNYSTTTVYKKKGPAGKKGKKVTESQQQTQSQMKWIPKAK
ncbi:isoform c [Stylonychia lemnae]|uniref:Isoform c n=1 Tax=Stylonychia lemnae TaxID=5949 RepID=A0A078B7M4_STYLE|nr:isoform c [Stylonychia lemnae]|eukprot:CDW89302.1 isoform c [Stylonychia lemnae]